MPRARLPAAGHPRSLSHPPSQSLGPPGRCIQAGAPQNRRKVAASSNQACRSASDAGSVHARPVRLLPLARTSSRGELEEDDAGCVFGAQILCLKNEINRGGHGCGYRGVTCSRQDVGEVEVEGAKMDTSQIC